MQADLAAHFVTSEFLFLLSGALAAWLEADSLTPEPSAATLTLVAARPALGSLAFGADVASAAANVVAATAAVAAVVVAVAGAVAVAP